jgi:hypothetical protein
MTLSEQKSIDSLRQLVGELRTENNKFREDVTNQVRSIGEAVERKHVPLSLETEVIKSLNSAVQIAFTSALAGYNSPLQKYVINVVEKYQESIEATFDVVLSEAIQTAEFKERVREVLLHKVAKTMISGIDGSVDKTVNQMKQDAIFRSRLTLAVNGLVNEFLKTK